MDTLQRITELREQRGWSKNHLAKMAKLPQSTVSNLYNRSYEPTIATLESLCSGFGITLAEFFSTNSEAVMLASEQKELLQMWSGVPAKQKAPLLELMKNM